METLYHYCSTAAFHSIVESKSIHLSSLSLSNDTLEGKLVADAVARLAERDGLNSSMRERLQSHLHFFDEYADGLGLCLSEDDDLLSQWRGYAANATGVAIGFSRDYLQWLSKQWTPEAEVPGFKLDQVSYDRDRHDAEVEPTYSKILKLIDAGAFEFPRQTILEEKSTEEEEEEERKRFKKLQMQLAVTTLTGFLGNLYTFKSPAFREEREWRLISHSLIGGDEVLSYRPAADRLVPYRKYDLKCLERQPIAEVVIGPKHLTPTNVIQACLKLNGFGDVTVRRSEASYR